MAWQLDETGCYIAACHAAQIAILAVDQEEVIIIQLEARLAVGMVTETAAFWNHALQFRPEEIGVQKQQPTMLKV